MPDITVDAFRKHRVWLADFLAEHSEFTGVDDFHDDFVDAGAAAFDLLPKTEEPPPPGPAVGSTGWLASAQQAQDAAHRDIRASLEREIRGQRDGWED